MQTHTNLIKRAMTIPTDDRQRTIELIRQLPLEKLTDAVHFLEFLSRVEQGPTLSPEETALIEIIQRHLPSEQQKRLNDLRDRSEWGDLTAAEHQELIVYEDLLKQHNVERFEALVKLAALRNTDPTTLNRHLVVFQICCCRNPRLSPSPLPREQGVLHGSSTCLEHYPSL